MEKNSNQTNLSEPGLCQMCFTFYGTPQHNFLCSKCFIDAQASENKQLEKKEVENSAEIAPKAPEEPVQPMQEDKTKCWNCVKKIGLLGFDCKCGYTFCKKHRMPEAHECGYDFVALGKQTLAQNNPLVKNEKIEKI